MTTNVRVSTSTRHMPARPERGLCISPPGEINAATSDMRVDVGAVGVGKREANCGVRVKRAASVTSTAPATSADKKRRKGRRAMQGGAQELDARLLHGAECSSGHVGDREEESLAFGKATEDMRAMVQGGGESDASHVAFDSAGDTSESVGEGGVALRLSAKLDGAVDVVKDSGASEKSSKVPGEGGVGEENANYQALPNCPVAGRECHSGLARPSVARNEHEVYGQLHEAVQGQADVYIDCHCPRVTVEHRVKPPGESQVVRSSRRSTGSAVRTRCNDPAHPGRRQSSSGPGARTRRGNKRVCGLDECGLRKEWGGTPCQECGREHSPQDRLCAACHQPSERWLHLTAKRAADAQRLLDRCRRYKWDFPDVLVRDFRPSTQCLCCRRACFGKWLSRSETRARKVDWSCGGCRRQIKTKDYRFAGTDKDEMATFFAGSLDEYASWSSDTRICGKCRTRFTRRTANVFIRLA